jgi:NAD-dependent DNA ligase
LKVLDFEWTLRDSEDQRRADKCNALPDTGRTQMKNTTQLTDKYVRNLAPPITKSQDIKYDSVVTGFGIRVTGKGSKSFVLNYHVLGRERRMTIGQYPDWSVAAAREQAAKLKRE